MLSVCWFTPHVPTIAVMGWAKVRPWEIPFRFPMLVTETQTLEPSLEPLWVIWQEARVQPWELRLKHKHSDVGSDSSNC